MRWPRQLYAVTDAPSANFHNVEPSSTLRELRHEDVQSAGCISACVGDAACSHSPALRCGGNPHKATRWEDRVCGCRRRAITWCVLVRRRDRARKVVPKSYLHRGRSLTECERRLDGARAGCRSPESCGKKSANGASPTKSPPHLTGTLIGQAGRGIMKSDKITRNSWNSPNASRGTWAVRVHPGRRRPS